MGPALGTAPTRGPCGFLHHGTSRRQSHTSAHAGCRAGNGEEWGRTLLARNPATLLLKSPQQAAWRSPRLSQGPMAASPARKSHSESFVGQTQGPALGTAPARGPWGFRHHVTSRRQFPTSAQARCRAGNGEERGQTLRARNPATLALKSPHQPHGVRPASVRGPWPRHRLENPTAKALLARPWAQPSARHPPAALGGSVITGSRGASRPTACTHAVGPGTGKSGGGPYALATLPRSRSRAPSKPHGVRPTSVRGPWPRHRLENPTVKALLARPRAQPSARRPPAARGGSVIPGPRGASRPSARTHAVGPGTGKSGGGPYALAALPRSRSRAPTSRMAFAPPQSVAHGRVTT